jgi:S-methylmethionine-dependent homocysteine/selenocysteine methylase
MTLPHLTSPTPFLTECGMETTLFYKHHIPLPCFSSTPLVDTPHGRALITSFYTSYARIAAAYNTGIILDTRTWRASTPWAAPLKLTETKLLELNRSAVRLLQDFRPHCPAPLVISGTLGPQHDAYADTSDTISLETARDGYAAQIRVLAAEGVDMLTLATVTNLNEAVAFLQLAREVDLPAVVSFSLESDGALLGGRTLESAVRCVDEATDGYAVYFGVNCVHPCRIAEALRGVSAEVRARIGMVRGNASLKTHAELDGTDKLDRGDVSVFVDGFAEVMRAVPGVRAVGGCCGTDEEHLQAIAGRFIPGTE